MKRHRYSYLMPAIAGSCVAAATLLAMPSQAAPASNAGSPTVVALTQVPCQFVESENGTDRGFQSRSKEDCERINGKTGTERLASAKPLELKPGRYIFRVANRSVPYELGFWLRGAGIVGRARLPSVSGGGLARGTTRDYEIDLVPGEYVYSCPLNTTPDYRLIVKN
ncbi:MAG: hypothetical protein HYU75_08000 [Betaproteobacteria bacterium]|nr:hypothetical protein [Betaproteobacteria bacterium]